MAAGDSGVDEAGRRGFDAPVNQPTPKQRAYLDFIRDHIALHRVAPAEHEMQAFFGVSPPAVHRMIVALTEKGLITREAGRARSIHVVEDVRRHEPRAVADWRPTRPPDDITAPLDADMVGLVEALRADTRVITKGSCSGHGKKPAYIDLAVEGLEGLRAFVERVNLVDRAVRNEALLDIALNWSEEVVTACAFDIFPDWIMLSWTIEGSGRRGAPSAALLAKIAKSYERADKASRRTRA